MIYKKYLFVIFLFLSNCMTDNIIKKDNNVSLNNIFSNKGFAMIYKNDLYDRKIISKKIDNRSLTIFQRNLKKNTNVKITNILNNKSIIAKVGADVEYPLFYNSVISNRIFNELDLDLEQPYIEIISIPDNSMFIAKRAKTYDEEKQVADKAPVKAISISNLNETRKNSIKKENKNFSFNIKIADFYFKKTALLMIDRIKDETKIKNPKIKKITDEKFRVYVGSFKDIISLQNSFNDISILNFENIEIIKND